MTRTTLRLIKSIIICIIHSLIIYNFLKNMDVNNELSILSSKIFQSPIDAKQNKSSLSSERLDELRRLLSNDSNGINVNYLEATHQIPKFHTVYCCGKKVENIDMNENPLIFLADKPKKKSIFLEQVHNRNDLLCSDWKDSNMAKVSCDDSHHN